MPPFHLEKKLYLLLIHRGTPITSPNLSLLRCAKTSPLTKFHSLDFTFFSLLPCDRNRNLSLPPLFLSFLSLEDNRRGSRRTVYERIRFSDIGYREKEEEGKSI